MSCVIASTTKEQGIGCMKTASPRMGRGRQVTELPAARRVRLLYSWRFQGCVIPDLARCLVNSGID
jgi:hypothetical protein